MDGKMKKVNQRIAGLAIVLIAMILTAASANACHISVKTLENQKKSYKVGDELVVKVTVQLTHRNCSEGIEATKFNPKDIKIVSAGKWSDAGNLVFERKLKIKITGKTNNQAILNVVRTCRRDGGSGKLTLKVE